MLYKHRLRFVAVAAIFYLCLAFVAKDVRAQGTVPAPDASLMNVSAAITIDRGTYHVGDDPLISIRLVVNRAQPVRVGPLGMVFGVVIHDATGRLIKKNNFDHLECCGTRPLHLAAGGTATLSSTLKELHYVLGPGSYVATFSTLRAPDILPKSVRFTIENTQSGRDIYENRSCGRLVAASRRDKVD